MAHSRAPHPLAEAIAELAAPPVAESFLLISAEPDLEPDPEEETTPALLLHLRPRRVAAGLEISVRCGSWLQDPQGTLNLPAEAAVLAVCRLPLAGAAAEAELDEFVTLLCAAEWWRSDGEGMRLQLPHRFIHWGQFGCAWASVHLQLMTPAGLQAAPGAPPGRLRLRPWQLHGRGLVSAAYVRGDSREYWQRQVRLRDRERERAALQGDPRPAAQAVLAAMPPPAPDQDNDETAHVRFSELRAGDMQRLVAAIKTAFQLACRFRGTVGSPLGVPAAAGAEDGAAEANDDGQ